MPDAAYWRRALRLFADDQVVVTFLDGEGRERRWHGQLGRLNDAGGPVVDVGGEERRLCRWEALSAVQDAEKAGVLQR